jgi:hypothetical protein
MLMHCASFVMVLCIKGAFFMKSIFTVAFSTILIPTIALAEPTVALLKCPAVPEAYSKMLTDLSVLKTAIKKDAACEPVQQEVSSLENLLGERRKSVLELIEKNKAEPLSERETKVIRTYVEDITSKVFSTAELLSRNNYCFEEDRKKLGLNDLASITLDATSLATMVAGPWAAPIAIGGQVLAGVFSGLHKVMSSQTGYDFQKLEQRQSFVQNLCAYYNYRQDIENNLYPKRRVNQLLQLRKSLDASLLLLEKNCVECKGIADLSLRSEGNFTSVKKLAKETNGAYEKPLGTFTVQTIASLQWVDQEVDRLVDESADEAGIGRDFVSEMKADIDRFLFERESPRFLDFQTNKAINLYSAFSNYVLYEASEIARASSPYTDLPYNAFYFTTEADALKLVSSLVRPLAQKGQSNIIHRIEDFERQATDLLERATLAVEVRNSYCNFFRKASLYNSKLQYSCEGRKAQSLLSSIESLKDLQEKPQSMTDLLATLTGKEENKELVTDWAKGLDKRIQTFVADPNLFRRK